MKKVALLLIYICFNVLFGQIVYQTEIQPIFNNNCGNCHLGNSAGGLNLSNYNNLMAGGNSGAVIVPFDHANSLLWQRVNNGSMPPGNNPDLSASEIDLIAQWIDEGALENPAYSGPVWYISIAGSDETGDGSEENPFATIQKGIDFSSEGDTVLVAAGTHVENINFNGKNIVVGSMYLTSGDSSYISSTIIDGNQNGSVVIFESGEDSTALFTGFSITNGLAGSGGGIYILGASPTLTNVTISGNSTGILGRGGGIYCDNSNSALTNVTITDNLASTFGGGMYCRENSNLTLTYVTITGNSSGYGGGGIYVSYISNPSLENVTITDNTVLEGAGGGIYCHAGSGPVLVNCILWNNLPHEIYFHQFGDSNSVTIAYSDIQGGEGVIVTNDNGMVYWEEGNIDANPLFCNLDNGDFTLAENSPCAGAGENGVNMGAFGVGCEAMLSPQEDVISVKFSLHQNYPNPFNPVTTLRYDLPEDALVRITIYDMMGRTVKTLINSKLTTGFKSIQWNATNDAGSPVSAGLYLYTIEAGDPSASSGHSFRQTRKMVLLK